MKIAVTYEKGLIFQHFGHSEKFKIYEVENNKIINNYIVDTNNEGHQYLSIFLNDLGINKLICGGIGNGAISALTKYNIEVLAGVKGNVDEAVELYLNGNLKYSSQANCNCDGNHDHHHHHNHKKLTRI